MVQEYVIGDRVWEDVNANGSQDDAEPGIAGITVTLYDITGSVRGSTVTDRDGHYEFRRTSDGSEWLSVHINLDYWVATVKDKPGVSEEMDSDINEFGWTDPFQLKSQSPSTPGGGPVHIPNIDAGLKINAPSDVALDFVDATGDNKLTELKIGLLDQAFDPKPPGELHGPVRADYIERDAHRFLVRVTDNTANKDPNVRDRFYATVTTGLDRGTDGIDMLESGNDTGIFYSASLLLVAFEDDDRIPQSIPRPTEDNQYNDRTFFSALEDKVTVPTVKLFEGRMCPPRRSSM